MPEGDTVHLAAARLAEALGGRIIRRSDFRVPRYAATDLSGRRVNDVTARGKHLLLRIEGELTLHTHFRMEGEWRLYRPGSRWRRPVFEVRLALHTDDWVAVGHRIPVVDLVPTSAEESIVGHLGPDVLGPDWDAGEALRRLASDPARPIGDALLDQTIMAGPGNVYRCEVCFLRGVHPSTPVGAIGDPSGLIDLVKRLMEANRTTGMQCTTGDTRRGRGRWVYGRRDEPCRRCGTPVVRVAEGSGREDRVMYFCPHCQPLRGPDGGDVQ